MVCMDFSKRYAKPTDLLQSSWRLTKLSPGEVMYATLYCCFPYKLAVRLSTPQKTVSEFFVLMLNRFHSVLGFPLYASFFGVLVYLVSFEADVNGSCLDFEECRRKDWSEDE
ncbi:unnamed protein product [Dovyalis caffra]|uniref:Uncharacterized protein n=1 Tax=Dovyalis caffra TaxID=77055 RepID=A0AAV1RT67_9ROSI|nr:unnamed protein product [Dovyalis caffra]